MVLLNVDDRARSIILHQDLKRTIIEAEEKYIKKKLSKGEVVNKKLMHYAINNRKSVKIIMVELNKILMKQYKEFYKLKKVENDRNKN